MLKNRTLVFRGGSGGVGRSPPLKPTKETSFTKILYHSENNIRDIRPFCRLFLSQKCCEVYFISLTVYSEPVVRLDYVIFLKSSSLTLVAGSAPAGVYNRFNQLTFKIKGRLRQEKRLFSKTAVVRFSLFVKCVGHVIHCLV